MFILNETWITKSNEHLVNIPNYNYVGKHRTYKKGGGVGFLVHNELHYKTKTDIKLAYESDLEYHFIELKTKKRNMILGSMYRPPQSKEKAFLKDYEKLIGCIADLKDKDLVIGIDHNMDLLKASKHTNTQKFLDYNLGMNMLPVITKPTRITDTSATLIDNILISNKLQCDYEPGIIISDLSDHLPTALKLKNVKQDMRQTQTTTYRTITPETIKLLNEDLKEYQWEEILKPLGTDEAFNALQNVLKTHMDKHMPLKTKKRTNRQQMKEAWIIKGIEKSMKKQKQLYIRHISKNATENDHKKYKEYRGMLQRIKRNAKITHYQKKCIDFKNETKKLWEIINTMIGRTRSKESTIESLRINNLLTYDANKLTDTFCNFFANVGKEYANKIPTSNYKIDHYLNKIPQNQKSLFAVPTTKTEIQRIISNLQSKNSSGHDEVSNKILKGISTGVSIPLSILANKSLSEGIFPTEMKKADTIPLYKSKDKNDKNNYRPISLLLTMSKVLEKVMYNRTYNFLNHTNQLFTSQYGFRTGHSCQEAIAELVGKITRNNDMGCHTIGVFIDLSKAFDTLEHRVLYEKLAIYGIRGVTLDWFKSYLTNRQLRVKCLISSTQQTEYSNYKPVEYGTPQGSCLGPLLFLIFINDLHRNLVHCNDIQFADDTTIYKGHRSMRYLKWCIEDDLANISDWFKANKLTLNLSKSVYMIFSKKNHEDIDLSLGDTKLPMVTSTKFLGIWMDQKLKWKEHLSKFNSKIKRNLTLLKIGNKHLNTNTKKVLYYAQIYSHLSYGIILWGNMVSNTQLLNLQKLQNKAIKIVDTQEGSPEKIYIKHEILKINEIIKVENCKLMYKLEHNILPGKLPTLFNTDNKGKSLEKNHSYNTRTKNIPKLSKAQSKIYLNSFLNRCVTDYQTVPIALRELTNIKLFSKKLKYLILSQKGITLS